MRNTLLFIGIFFLFLACNKSDINQNFVDIQVHSLYREIGDRNGKDYVRLWVNDTLLFSDTIHTTLTAPCRMKAATILKSHRDSVKIRVRLVSLDSVLFADKHAVDTTFRYMLNNIPYLAIDYYRELNHFRVLDPVHNRQYFSFD